jgi:hypothetical protein
LLDAEQLRSVRVPYFAGLPSIGEYAGYRLSEHAVHTWDVAVALDPAATIPAAEVDLLWQRLDLAGELHLYPGRAVDPAATVRGSAEAALRLVYGRSRPQDGLEVTGKVTLDDLRQLFPGY